MTNDLFAKTRPFTRSKAGAVVITLVLACAAVATYKLLSKGRGENKGISLLNEVYKSHRSIESRVAGFGYAPLISTRGGEGESAPDNLSIARAERVILDAVYYKPDAESHHALGVHYLLKKQFDDAIKEFEKALDGDPSNARLHSDLGAALLEKGRKEMGRDSTQAQFTGKPIQELSRSLEHIHKALDLDASLKEAIFNLGLAQDSLRLRFAARDTLSKYLEVDSDSGWAGEARKSISRQDEKGREASLTGEELLAYFLDAFKKKDEERAWELISKNRSPLNGKYISELLVDAYIDQSLNLQKEEAANTLSALSFLARLEAQRADEHYSEKLAGFYKNQKPANLARSKQARELVRRGHEMYRLGKYNEAVSAYAGARKIFDELKNKAESLSTEYRVAYCDSESRNTGGSLPVFERLAASCEKERFKLLQAANLLGLASDEFSRKKYSKAIELSAHALELSRQVGDEVLAFSSLESSTEFYRAIGNHKKALACIQNSLEYSDCPSLNQIKNFSYYSLAASALSSAGYADSSLEYRKEAARFLMQDVPRDAAVYFADLGATYSKLKKYDEALVSLNLSNEHAQAISPEDVKKMVLVYVALYKAGFHKNRLEFQDALSSYDDALSLSHFIDFPVFTYQARKGRLFCYIALGANAMAEMEISDTLKLLETDRSQILEQENRNCFFDAEQDVYDLAIDYECSRRNDFLRAFDYSEESRGRSMLDLLKSQPEVKYNNAALDIIFRNASRPLTFQDIKSRLPERLQVIQYSVLANKIIIWVLSSNGLHPAVVEISQEELNKKVRAYLDHISHYSADESAAIAAQSQELFDILIKPVSHLLNPDQTICVVPDKVLNNLPFETLISTQTQRYLIEDFAVIYSPSSSVLLACIEGAKSKESPAGERLLSIGNPRFDFSLFKELPDLPAAAEEAKKIAKYYRHSICLINDGAKEGWVKSEMQEATDIHLAAHSVLDEESVLRSKILLAKETSNIPQGNDGVLESHEIYNMRLPKTRLVILSSCQSGIDRYYKGEGMMSLARSFMAAGVPTVVASLWNTDSNATADLMIEFHRLKQQEGLPVGESLRKAKLSVLRDQGSPFRHPYFWSGFIVIGGEARF